MNTSNAVFPALSTICSVTGRRNWIERPRSPCAALPIQLKYWTMIGLSSPSRCRSSSICSSEATGPAAIAAGSPGVTWITVKTTNVTPKIVGMAMSNLFAKNAATERLLVWAGLTDHGL